MSKDTEEDSGWANALGSVAERSLCFFKVLLGDELSISCDIDDLFEQGVHHAVHAQADVAADWAATGGVLLGISALAIWDGLLLWVPLSEGVLILVVLDLLGHDGRSSALVEVELNSVLTDVNGIVVVVSSGSNEVFTTLCECAESIT